MKFCVLKPGKVAWVVGVLCCVFSVRGAEEIETNLEKAREHWAFKAPKPYSLPVVKNRSWVRQRLDYFVLAELEKREMGPTPQADRKTLLRRLHFDIRGLPPSAEEVKTFLKDTSPEAYERTVNELLDTREFGERMASLWLPLARYAEDQAHQVGDDTKFFYPNAYRYREWVIDAFNQDLSYKNFLQFQLAADQIEEGKEKHLPALGFLGLGPKYYDRKRIEVMADEWEDRVDTVSRTMLGLTVACARCHNHKFEAISMKDYYAMAGVFASTKMVNKTPTGLVDTNDGRKMFGETLHLVEDGSSTNLPVFLRGNPKRPGAIAEKRFLEVLCDGQPEPFKNGSGRRDLSQAIASEGNPLTARVFVNRIWGAFFGKGLVNTPSNFGQSGDLPSHPELLDDLAARFMQNGWSTKWLIREIVLSSTYRQGSTESPEKMAVDPENRLLWKMSRKRLSIEQWRDSVLLISGNLDRKASGKSLELDDPKNNRRTVYARISRLKLNDLLMQFDYPDANVHAEKRSTTTTSIQKLYLLNNPFVLAQAKLVSEKVDASKKRERVREIYRVIYGRDPDARETRLGMEFLQNGNSGDMPAEQQLAQALMVSNEFFYVD